VNINDTIKQAAGLPVASQHAAQTRSGSAAQKANTTPTSASSDSVKLSSNYQAIESQVSSSESFNAQKVAEIKAAIANGQFQINPEKVAAGLIDSVQNLLSARA
jgi:negative regulator of flagellin synthesis FlgM